ncbi:MAG TPA: CdaR family protein [Candidatus Binatia bacterium]|jgi:YbbR domain-containing protein
MKQVWERVVLWSGSNFGLKVLALVIALGLWLAGHRDTERAIEVPVEFRNIPQDLMVMDNRIDYVVLRLMGPRTLVSTLDSQTLKLSLDLAGAKSGSASFPLGADDFNVPRGVAIGRITPPVIHLRLEPVVKRMLPVTVRLSGKPTAGYVIGETAANPRTVSVQGPAEEVRRLSAIETISVDVEDSRSAIKRRVRLSTDGKPLTLSPDQVDVVVNVEEQQVVREFDRVEVQAKDFKGAYTISPQWVKLRLAGPKTVVEKLDLTADNVFLDLHGMSAGDHNVELSFNLPPEIRVVEQRPQRVRVRIVKPAA